VKIGGAELRVCGGLGLLPLCGRGRLCVCGLRGWPGLCGWRMVAAAC